MEKKKNEFRAIFLVFVVGNMGLIPIWEAVGFCRYSSISASFLNTHSVTLDSWFVLINWFVIACTMLLGSVGRYSPRLRSSYIEISNYFRGRQAGLRAGLRTPIPQYRAFHVQSCLREQPHIHTDHQPFLERYKEAGMAHVFRCPLRSIVEILTELLNVDS